MPINTTNNLDALIVLANTMDAQGNLNPESTARANMAAEIFKKLAIPKIVTCGWDYRNDSSIRIGEAFKEYLITNFQINEEKILVEGNSRDTVGDAFFTKINFALPLTWKNILVITSSYHVRRTQEIFNFIYGNNFLIKVCGAKVDQNDSILENELLSTQSFRDTFLEVSAGNDVQILSRLREAHPYYNGVIYKKIAKLF